MGYRSLADCVTDLKNTGQLVVIDEEVDPNLEAAAIVRRVYEASGPAILFRRLREVSRERSGCGLTTCSVSTPTLVSKCFFKVTKCFSNRCQLIQDAIRLTTRDKTFADRRTVVEKIHTLAPRRIAKSLFEGSDEL